MRDLLCFNPFNTIFLVFCLFASQNGTTGLQMTIPEFKLMLAGSLQFWKTPSARKTIDLYPEGITGVNSDSPYIYENP